jgi:hypothetical protein
VQSKFVSRRRKKLSYDIDMGLFYSLNDHKGKRSANVYLFWILWALFFLVLVVLARPSLTVAAGEIIIATHPRHLSQR